MLIFYKKQIIRIFFFVGQKLKLKLLFKKSKVLNNDKGMATLETIPLLVVFMVLMTYAMGFWGTVHSSILNSIAARTYAFETFRNRSNLLQFRETEALKYYKNRSFRFHAINGEDTDENVFVATKRPISFSNFQTRVEGGEKPSAQVHNSITIVSDDGRGPSSTSAPKGVDPIWIQIGYGYCLDVACGPR